jgi:hypothetical protein
MFKVFIRVRLLEVQQQARWRAPLRRPPAVERDGVMQSPVIVAVLRQPLDSSVRDGQVATV